MTDPTFFPAWLRLTHLINIILMTFLLRSGLQIFSAFPRLYLSDNTRPGDEWLKLNRNQVPEEDPDEVYQEIMKREEEGKAGDDTGTPPPRHSPLRILAWSAAALFVSLPLLLNWGSGDSSARHRGVIGSIAFGAQLLAGALVPTRRSAATPVHPPNRIYTSLDEEADISPWLALPGHKQLGLGRHWHFASDVFWIANGLAFVILVFVTGYWRFLVPQSWSIFPEAGRAIWTYLHLALPPELPGQPFNAIQKLSYFAIIFIVAPTQILTGLAMSPSLTAQYPWYLKLFGGRQKARSLHFVSFVLFVLFIIVHVTMVFLHGFAHEAGLIIWGRAERPAATVGIAVAVLCFIILICALANWASLRHPRKVQRALGVLLHRILTDAFGWEASRQEYPRGAASSYFWVNGQPPVGQDYKDLARRNFTPWRLTVKGLVEQPLSLSLDDLRKLPKETQVTKHNCIQGWSDIAEWGGVSMSTILNLCRPKPEAGYVVFHAMDNKSETEPERIGEGYFYGTLNIQLARHPQTILAYEMNGEPLPVPHGAPLRL